MKALPMTSLNDIKAFTDKIAEQFHPDKIILFGSYAYGVPTPDSDVDILVILSFEGRPVQKAIEISSAIGYPTFATDLLVRHTDDIQWRYEGGDPLIGDALDHGIVLYEKQKDNHPRVA